MANGASSYRRFLDGDNSSLAELIRDYKDGLILFLTGIVGDVLLAEELTEDTFVKLVVKRPRFDDTASFKTWLYTIGRNLALDHIRKHSRTVSIPPQDFAALKDTADIETEYLKTEQNRELHRAMYSLKPEYRQVLFLIYFEDMTHKQAAAVMKKSVRNIGTLVHRAKNSLKTQLEKEGFVYEKLY